MPRARYKPLNVFLNSRLVGRLLRERSGAVSFQYDSSWLAWEHVLPISLSLPLRAALTSKDAKVRRAAVEALGERKP